MSRNDHSAEVYEQMGMKLFEHDGKMYVQTAMGTHEQSRVYFDDPVPSEPGVIHCASVYIDGTDHGKSIVVRVIE